MPFIKSLDQILGSATRHIDFIDDRPVTQETIAMSEYFTQGINPNFSFGGNSQAVANALVPSPFTNLFNATHSEDYLRPIYSPSFLESNMGKIALGVGVAVLLGVIAKRR